MSIDWSEIQRVDTDLPSRLNRAFRSLTRDAREVDDQLDDIDVRIEALEAGSGSASPTGAAGGDLDGTYPDPSVAAITETSGPTRLVIDGIADGEFLKRSGAGIVGGNPGELDLNGSIFSMTAPLGGTAPLVAWNFCDAAGVSTANISGDSQYDLTSSGSPDFPGYVPFNAPSAVLLGSGSLGSFAVDAHAQISPAPSSLLLQAAMSVEWLGHLAKAPTTNFFAVGVGGDTEVEANNYQWVLIFNQAGPDWEYFAENGAGTTDITKVLQTLKAGAISTNYGTALLTMTRSAGNTVKFYVNGRLISSGTPTPNSLPTGGSTARLVIGRCPGGGAETAVGVTYAARVFNYELTADQVLESYSRTFFGKAAP